MEYNVLEIKDISVSKNGGDAVKKIAVKVRYTEGDKENISDLFLPGDATDSEIQSEIITQGQSINFGQRQFNVDMSGTI